VEPFAATSYLVGLSNYLGTTAQVRYARGLPSTSELAQTTSFTAAENNGQAGLRAEFFSNGELQGEPAISRTDLHVNFGPGSFQLPPNTSSSRWTGYYTPSSSGPYEIFVESTGEDGGYFRLYVDDKLIFDDWTTAKALLDQTTLSLGTAPHKVVLEQRGRSAWLGARLRLGIVKSGSAVTAEAKKLASSADVVLVAAGFDPNSESEGADRTFRLPPGQDELIQEMTKANKNTIVILTSGGSVDTTAWLSSVPAVVEGWYSGQEGGEALAKVLFGEVNPSGRLPISFERRWEDNPVHDSYYQEAGTKRVMYKEGVFVGYRGYERNETKPLFPFGHGLSYTTFRYSNLNVAQSVGEPTGWKVSFDVTNTGAREGAEVAQVYVGDHHAKVPRPAKELKGFSKIDLRPGETKRVTVSLDSRALSYYDANGKQWVAEPGVFDVLVGRSSEQIELRGTLDLATAIRTK